jgi:hypothetical protein
VYLDGVRVEAVVGDACFEALQPAERELLEEMLAARQADSTRLMPQPIDQVAPAQYAARLAQRQSQAVDPDHRLVAAALERRWEVAVQALASPRAIPRCGATSAI